MENKIVSAGKAPRIADVHVIALYDPANGGIHHLHTVTVFEGGRAVSEQDAVSAAKALALKAGHPVEKLKVRTSKDLRHSKEPHRIDIKSGNFVPVAAKATAKA